VTPQDYEHSFTVVITDQHALIARCLGIPGLQEQAGGLLEAARATLHRAELILTTERLCKVHASENELVDGDELVNAMRRLHHLIRKFD
jgi:hypothetical protein